MQRKAAIFRMQDQRQGRSVTKMLTKLNWEILEERCRMTMTYKICNDLMGIKADQLFLTSKTENVGIRNITKESLKEKKPMKDVYKHSFIPRASREWNQLTTEAKEAKSLKAFKSIIKAPPSLSNSRMLSL